MKKEKETKKDKTKKEPKVVHKDGLGEIKNPVNTKIGKLVIWFLVAMMAILPIVVLIWVLVEKSR